MRKKLPIGTKIRFDLAQGLDTGTARIVAVDTDDEDKHTYYKLDVISGSPADKHRNKQGELWVNDFEVRALSS